MHKMCCHRQGRLLLVLIELRQGGADQALNTLLPQQLQQTIE